MFDGHGGDASAQWLQQHLYDDVMARVDQQLLRPEPAAEPVPNRPGVVRPGRAEQLLVDVFQQADKELLQYLLGEPLLLCGEEASSSWLGDCIRAVGQGAAVRPCTHASSWLLLPLLLPLLRLLSLCAFLLPLQRRRGV